MVFLERERERKKKGKKNERPDDVPYERRVGQDRKQTAVTDESLSFYVVVDASASSETCREGGS